MVTTLGAGLLAVAIGPLAPASTLVSVRRAPDGHGAQVHLSAVVDAPIEDVQAVVGNFPAYPEWFPTLQSVHRRGPGQFDAVFRLPWPLKTVRERLAFTTEQLAGTIVIRWRQIEGDFARDEGRWTLHAVDGGRTALRYDSLLQFRRWVPVWLIARAERRVAPQLLSAIEARAQANAQRRRAGADASASR